MNVLKPQNIRKICHTYEYVNEFWRKKTETKNVKMIILTDYKIKNFKMRTQLIH